MGWRNCIPSDRWELSSSSRWFKISRFLNRPGARWNDDQRPNHLPGTPRKYEGCPGKLGPALIPSAQNRWPSPTRVYRLSEDAQLRRIPFRPLGWVCVGAAGMRMGLHPCQLRGAGLKVAVGVDDQGAGQRHSRALDALVTREAHVAPRYTPLSVGSMLTNLTSAHPNTSCVIAPLGVVFLTVVVSCQRPDSGSCGTTGPPIGVVGWLLPSSGR